jgi:hypothetical protein
MKNEAEEQFVWVLTEAVPDRIKLFSTIEKVYDYLDKTYEEYDNLVKHMLYDSAVYKSLLLFKPAKHDSDTTFAIIFHMTKTYIH